MHAETRARLDRLVARRENRAPHDWAEELRGLADVAPGWPRLVQGFAVLSGDDELDALDLDDEIFMEWLEEGLREVAAQGAVLVEVRFGARWGLRPGFMSLFREIERRVRESCPDFYAEALVTNLWPTRPVALEAFEDSLRAAFAAHGTVLSAVIVQDRETDRSRGFGFVEMENDSEAETAISQMNGTDLDGRTLTVNEARPRADRGGGGGGGGGGGRRGRNSQRW